MKTKLILGTIDMKCPIVLTVDLARACFLSSDYKMIDLEVPTVPYTPYEYLFAPGCCLTQGDTPRPAHRVGGITTTKGFYQ